MTEFTDSMDLVKAELAYEEAPYLLFDNDELIYGSASMAVWGNPDASNYLTNYTTRVDFMGHKIRWHKLAVVPLKKVEVAIKATSIIYKWDVVQTYNNRNIAGTNVKSMHAWPLAVDINPTRNPYVKGKQLITDIPLKIRNAFKDNGFFWGGDWVNIKDAMHFEYRGAPVKPGDTPPSDTFPYGKRMLKVKRPYMRGMDVLWVQQQCNKLKTYPQTGMTKLKEDMVFGPQTESCVKVFQYRYKLVVDGIVGPNTWREMRRETNNL